jgi:hypothetical protein
MKLAHTNTILKIYFINYLQLYLFRLFNPIYGIYLMKHGYNALKKVQ